MTETTKERIGRSLVAGKLSHFLQMIKPVVKIRRSPLESTRENPERGHQTKGTAKTHQNVVRKSCNGLTRKMKQEDTAIRLKAETKRMADSLTFETWVLLADR
jgi:hypothetical protein